MAGFAHQFKRDFHPAEAADLRKLVPLGRIKQALVWTPTYAYAVEEDNARGEIDRLALRIDPPRVSANFLAPVDDVSLDKLRSAMWLLD